MVGQMLFETMEGIEEWSKGDREEAAAHLTGVMINFAQLAIMAAGNVLPAGAAASVKPSAFIDQLKRLSCLTARRASGSRTCRPYAHNLALPKGRRQASGGYTSQRKEFLKHENKYFEVETIRRPVSRDTPSGSAAGVSANTRTRRCGCLEDRARPTARVGQPAAHAAPGAVG